MALGLGGPALRAADFEIGPQDNHSQAEPQSAPADTQEDLGLPAPQVPLRLDAGDVPTAYTLRKYATRLDLRFHDGGGILGKVYLGLFSRFFVGGAVELRNVIGSGEVRPTRDDAQLLARLQLIKEDAGWPSLALGWDGPAYERGEAKGLYAVLSKELATPLGYLLLSGGANSAAIDTFVASRDLRASASACLAVRNVGLFTELDEVLQSQGSRWNAGLSISFAPLTLGLEFRDLASLRPATPVSRLLRVSWNGRF